MQIALLIVGLAVLGLLGYVAWVQKQVGQGKDDEILKQEIDELRRDLQEGRERDREHLQVRIDDLSKTMDRRQEKSAENLQDQFRQYAQTLKEVTEGLTKLDQTNKQVVGFSQQLKDLQSIFMQPKGKGAISEYWLETLLGHVLQPGQYKMQYKFQNGETVDAAVFFQEKIIPIDAKFSSNTYAELLNEDNEKKRKEMEAIFKTHLKDRIDETAKYIRPSEATTDFAFMFLPADGIFYDVLIGSVGSLDINRQSLNEYAFGKRVIIVSPTTFFAYLQTVLQGLKAFKMEESIHDVLKKVEKLGTHMNSFDTYMKKMGDNLGTTVNMYNQAYGELRKVDRDVLKLTNGEVGGAIEPNLIEKPTAQLD